MKVKKALLKRALDNGAINEVCKRIAASEVLMWALDNMLVDIEDIMKNNGLMLGEVKQKYGAVLSANNRFFTEVSDMLGDNDNRMNMYLDIDDFMKGFRSWAGLNKKEEKE